MLLSHSAAEPLDLISQLCIVRSGGIMFACLRVPSLKKQNQKNSKETAKHHASTKHVFMIWKLSADQFAFNPFNAHLRF